MSVAVFQWEMVAAMHVSIVLFLPEMTCYHFLALAGLSWDTVVLFCLPCPALTP